MELRLVTYIIPQKRIVMNPRQPASPGFRRNRWVHAWYAPLPTRMSLRVTPAMAAGVTDRLWEIEDIVDPVEAAAPKPGPRGHCGKQDSN